MTVEVLALTERTDEVNLHLNGIKLIWGHIEEHINSGRLANAITGWDDMIKNYIDDPKQPFRNAAWWALFFLCPPSERAKYGLRNPLQPRV
ncbi:hypothetical protein D9M70_559490 [compost metagenome]